MKIIAPGITSRKAFSLLEILLVIAAIAILAGIVILALNPAKQLADTRNAERRSDVNAILNAVWTYGIDNGGEMPTAITVTSTEICKTGAECTNLIDLSGLTTGTGSYILAIPTDPKGSSTNGSGYEVMKTSVGRITVSAPHAENQATISVTR